jgi:hypothetical protein
MMARKSYVIPDNQLSLFDDLDTPSMPVFDKSRCEARLINYETAARMVETYHYAHRVPSIMVAVGIFIDEILGGVCTYGMPPAKQICDAFDCDNVLELNRLYIHNYGSRNSESWLIGQSFKFLPKPSVLVSYADIGQNHIGYVYQATNWLYTGFGNTGGSGSHEYIVNNKRMHAKNINNIYGTIKKHELENRGVTIEKLKKSLKHRYVYFLGSKSQRKTLRKALRWPVLPYPKNDEN